MNNNFLKILTCAALALFVMPALSLPAHAAGAAAEEEGDGPSSSFEFVRLEPLVLPIIDENGVSQTLNLVVAIEVKKVSHAERVRTLQPRIKDAMIQEMYGLLNRHAAYKGGVLQVKFLKDRLTKISQRVVGDDIVQGVLLQVVQQRQL